MREVNTRRYFSVKYVYLNGKKLIIVHIRYTNIFLFIVPSNHHHTNVLCAYNIFTVALHAVFVLAFSLFFCCFAFFDQFVRVEKNNEKQEISNEIVQYMVLVDGFHSFFLFYFCTENINLFLWIPFCVRTSIGYYRIEKLIFLFDKTQINGFL